MIAGLRYESDCNLQEFMAQFLGKRAAQNSISTCNNINKNVIMNINEPPWEWNLVF